MNCCIQTKQKTVEQSTWTRNKWTHWARIFSDYLSIAFFLHLKNAAKKQPWMWNRKWIGMLSGWFKFRFRFNCLFVCLNAFNEQKKNVLIYVCCEFSSVLIELAWGELLSQNVENNAPSQHIQALGTNFIAV